MENILIIALIVVAILLIILAIGYNQFIHAVKVFNIKATAYEVSYVDIAKLVENISENQVLHEREILVLRTVLSIHSEALNVNMIQDLFKEIDALKAGERDSIQTATTL